MLFTTIKKMESIENIINFLNANRNLGNSFQTFYYQNIESFLINLDQLETSLNRNKDIYTDNQILFINKIITIILLLLDIDEKLIEKQLQIMTYYNIQLENKIKQTDITIKNQQDLIDMEKNKETNLTKRFSDYKNATYFHNQATEKFHAPLNLFLTQYSDL